jgi:2-dehydro-3-deoxygluconokinase
MCEVLTIGEPMALFVADQEGPLETVDHFTKYVSGSEVNFSVGMSRLGHQVAYITKMGQDPFGKYINHFLQDNHIDTRYFTFDDAHTTGFQLKEKVHTGDPEVVSFRKNSAAANMELKDLEAISWQGVKHLHVTGIPPALSQSCRDVMYQLIALAREHGVTISFDPNLRPKQWESREKMIEVINDLACRCDLVLPGINEGKILLGSDDPKVIADYYLKAGVKTVIVKLGAKGAFVKTQQDSFISAPFKVEKVVDTVGAGDGFAVGVVSALMEGLPLADAAVRGNAIGALAVMAPGDNDGLPNKEQLSVYLKKAQKKN